jgi:hypothetical protein
VIARGGQYSDIARGRWTVVILTHVSDDASVLLQPLGRAIGGTVIYDDYLVRLQGLLQHALNGFIDTCLAIECGTDDAHLAHANRPFMVGGSSQPVGQAIPAKSEVLVDSEVGCLQVRGTRPPMIDGRTPWQPVIGWRGDWQHPRLAERTEGPPHVTCGRYQKHWPASGDLLEISGASGGVIRVPVDLHEILGNAEQ